MTLDISNAFLQTEISLNGDKIIIKIRGRWFDILLKICLGVYDKYIWYKGGQKILYGRILKAFYGMIVSSVHYYKKVRKDIEVIGF